MVGTKAYQAIRAESKQMYRTSVEADLACKRKIGIPPKNAVAANARGSLLNHLAKARKKNIRLSR